MELPRLPHLHRRMGGAPLALPAVLDRLSERWWRLPPRVRMGVGLVAVVAALALVGRGAARSPWGPPTTVLVAATDLPAGTALAGMDVRRASWPAGLVPDDALAQVPPDARLATSAVAGAVLTTRHVARGLAGLLDAGEAAVSVPLDGLPVVAAGQVVDVVASRRDGSGVRVAVASRVLAVDDAWLWLAVPVERVEQVAAAGAAGRISLAIRPPVTADGSPGDPGASPASP